MIIPSKDASISFELLILRKCVHVKFIPKEIDPDNLSAISSSKSTLEIY